MSASTKIPPLRAIPLLEKAIAQGKLCGPPTEMNYALGDWVDQTSLLISETEGINPKFPEIFQKAVERIFGIGFVEEVRAAALSRALSILEGQVEILRVKASEDTAAIVSKPLGRKVFIGHGHSPAWLELQNYLRDRMRLGVVHFSSVPNAGKTTIDRLKEMVDSVGFALLVMTGEDEVGDGSFRARQNVIHEIGLFQGRLGFERAIILLEEGCEEFSNVSGLTYIGFPKGRIAAAFHEIHETLEAAGLVKPIAP